jgi:hypothetical protein
MQQFGAFFAEIFGRLWARALFPIPGDDELDPVVLEVLQVQAGAKLEAFDAAPTGGAATMEAPSAGTVWMFERAWARLYGTVTLEVFGHLHPGFVRTGALFMATLRDIGRDIGLEPQWERLRAIAGA